MDELFEQFWNAGMRKTNKKAARKKFLILAKKSVNSLQFTEMLVNDIQKRIKLQQFGFDCLHPLTYLNNERWEDEYREDSKRPRKKTASERMREQSLRIIGDCEAGSSVMGPNDRFI